MRNNSILIDLLPRNFWWIMPKDQHFKITILEHKSECMCRLDEIHIEIELVSLHPVCLFVKLMKIDTIETFS